MRDENYLQHRRPRRMFAKMLEDSRAFYVSAVEGWDRAHRLADETSVATADRRKRDRESGMTRLEMDHEDFRIESAFTSATFNYAVSLELLLKAFVGVARRFDEQSLRDMEGLIGHKLVTALAPELIPARWTEQIEKAYQDAEMARTDVAAYYDAWDPPTGRWISDTKRLATPTLRSFLDFLSREGAAKERYSFTKVSRSDWRIKLAGYDRVAPFHATIEELLIAKAREKGCWQKRLQLVSRLDQSERAALRPMQMKFATPKDKFEFEKTVHSGPPPEAGTVHPEKPS